MLECYLISICSQINQPKQIREQRNTIYIATDSKTQTFMTMYRNFLWGKPPSSCVILPQTFVSISGIIPFKYCVTFGGFFRVRFWQEVTFYNKHNNKQNQVKRHFLFLKVKCISQCNVLLGFIVFGFLQATKFIHQIKNGKAPRPVNQTSRCSIVFSVDAQAFFLHFVSFLLLLTPIPKMTVIFWNISLASLAPPRFPPSLCFSFVKDHTEGWHVGGTSRLGGPAAGKMWVTGSAVNRLWQ